VKKKPITFGKPGFELVASMEEKADAIEREASFRIALLGDFSGRASRMDCETGDALARRRSGEVGRDNLDEVMAGLGVSLRIKLPGKRSPRVELRFKELDDFHPDRIFERVGIFRSLRETRSVLQDPRTFASASAGLRGGGPRGNVPPESGKSMEPDIAAIAAAGDLLDHVLEETEGRPSGGGRGAEGTEWDAFLGDIVRPHLVARDDPRQAEMVTAVDAAVAEMMRNILHHPDFQALEAAWRAVRFLTSRVETDARLTVHLIDVSKAELAKDLASTEDLRATGTYRLIAESTVETFGAVPWAILAGFFAFDRNREDAALLGRIAGVAARAKAPFVAEACARLLGCDALAEAPDPARWRIPAAAKKAADAWDAFRSLPEAAYVGLALPRFLLRMPYGADTDPVERFAFEEIPGEPVHGNFLWGNPAVACACMLACEFGSDPRDASPAEARELDGLPLYVYDSGGERRALPCAEVVLTERAAEAIMNRGIMPLLCFKGRDTVRLTRFQSAAEPATRLAGRWEDANRGG
jgi:type VI secretion system protein ImpC